MGILALKADERVKGVRCGDDALAVDLMDAGRLQFRWPGTRGCSTPPRSNETTGVSARLATASTGPTSTKT